MQPAVRIKLVATLLCLAGAGSAAQPVQGETPANERVERAERRFGDVRFVMGAGHAMPWLEMHVRGDLVAAFRDFDAQEVHASPDGKYFLALSNRARSSLAYGVLDRQGRLVFSSAHAAPSLHYCLGGVAREWTWIDPAKPVARFELDTAGAPAPAREYLKSVTVQGCDGRDVLLGKAHPTLTGRRINTLIDGRRVVPPSSPPAAPATEPAPATPTAR